MCSGPLGFGLVVRAKRVMSWLGARHEFELCTWQKSGIHMEWIGGAGSLSIVFRTVLQLTRKKIDP